MTSSESLPAASLRVRAALEAAGVEARIVAFDQGTRTAADAAAAIGCEVAQIAKSLVFRASPSGRAVLVIASGASRVDEAKVAAALGESIGKADAAFVRDKTGFAIGGVPPVGHTERPVIFIDQGLFRFQEIWAAAGTPNTVFRLTPGDLVAMTAGSVMAVS